MTVPGAQPYDCVIIGGGIVGLAVAMKLLQQRSHCRVAVIEKERDFGLHQTGHNSGVIHSGIYYKPGSLKAHLCVEGARQLIDFCTEQGVSYEMCGKVVVACEPAEIPFLQELHRRGTANGIEGLRLLSPGEVKGYEPHVHCIQGMFVPTTGIVEFRRVAQAYAQVFQSRGGDLLPGHKLMAVREEQGMLRIHTSQGILRTRFLANCGGLYADHVARMTGLKPPCRIVPFRGEYYEIAPERARLVRTLIYPVPDPRFPFLGVHFTRMINGKVEAGPNAVLAWAREGYTKSALSPGELLETLSYPGFWRLAARYWKPAFQEIRRSYSKRLFHKALQKLVPDIRQEDLIPGGAGVRAQALRTDGSLLDDFLIMPHGRSIHVLNAPSPAATSSLAIADHILRVGLLPAL